MDLELAIKKEQFRNTLIEKYELDEGIQKLQMKRHTNLICQMCVGVQTNSGYFKQNLFIIPS